MIRPSADRDGRSDATDLPDEARKIFGFHEFVKAEAAPSCRICRRMQTHGAGDAALKALVEAP
jgi:hypothetical protein